jgi:Tol biopolymer transport system component
LHLRTGVVGLAVVAVVVTALVAVGARSGSGGDSKTVVAAGAAGGAADTALSVDDAPGQPAATSSTSTVTAAPQPAATRADDPVVVAQRRRPTPGTTAPPPLTTPPTVAPVPAPAPTTTVTTLPPRPTPPVDLRGKLVYSSDAGGPDGHAVEEDIWVSDPDGTNARRFVAVAGMDMYPDLSPDGRRLTWSNFVREDAPNGWRIVVADADGSNLRTLVKAPGAAQYPRFSPDGTEILFRTAADGSGSAAADASFFIMSSDGSNLREVPGAAELKPWRANWGSDGRHIVIDSWASATYGPLDRGLWVLDLQDGSRRSLGIGAEPAWSPDGKQIAFARNDGLWIVDRDGLDRRLLVPGHCGDPSWSPDGALLTYRCIDDDPYGDYDVWTMRADGTEQKNLTDSRRYQERYPSF